MNTFRTEKKNNKREKMNLKIYFNFFDSLRKYSLIFLVETIPHSFLCHLTLFLCCKMFLNYFLKAEKVILLLTRAQNSKFIFFSKLVSP